MTNKELAAVVLAAHVSAQQAMTIDTPDMAMLDVGMRSMDMMAAQKLRSPLGVAARNWAKTGNVAARDTAVRLAMLVIMEVAK